MQHLKVRNHSIFFDPVANKGTGQFLAAGDNTVWFSKDAGLWEGHLASGNHRDVIRAKDLYLAVGSFGGKRQILTSTDGYRWIPKIFSASGSFNGITFALNRFWVVGDAGDLQQSTDGSTWTVVPIHPDFTTANLRSISYINGQFFVTGAAGALMTSVDGVTWKKVTIPSSSRTLAITFGVNQYVVSTEAGEMYTSSNAKNFQLKVIFSYSANRALFMPSTKYFVTVGAFHSLAASANMGNTWDALYQETQIAPFEDLDSLAYGQNQIVAGGPEGTVLRTTNPYNSIEEIDRYYWKFTSMAYGNGRYYSVGDAYASASWDGKSAWKISGAIIDPEDDYVDVDFADGKFYLIGRKSVSVVTNPDDAVRDQGNAPAAEVLLIPGGLNPYTPPTDPPAEPDPDADPIPLIPDGDGKAVAAGGGYLLVLTRSGDSGGFVITKTAEPNIPVFFGLTENGSIGLSWNSAAYGLDENGKALFVAVGDFGGIHEFSPDFDPEEDEVFFRSCPSGTADKLVDVTFCNDKALKLSGFFAVSEQGSITQSVDGKYWRSYRVPVLQGHEPSAIRYGNGELVVVCKNGKIFTAPVKEGGITGGIPPTWTERSSPVETVTTVTGTRLLCLAFGDDKFVSAGDTVALSSTSVKLPPVVQLPSNNVEGQVGVPFVFEFQIIGEYKSVKLVGQVPPGLELSSDTMITGTPTTEGVYRAEIQVTSESGNVAQPIVFTIKSATGEPPFDPGDPDSPKTKVKITSSSKAKGARTQPFLYEIETTGPKAKLKVIGKLPPGVKLHGQKLEGRPTKEGNYHVTLQAVGPNNTAKKNLKIHIDPKPPIKPL